MLSVDEARARLAEIAGRLPGEETDLAMAAGLVLAADIAAGRDLPGFDNSAMDGFAVRASDLVGASRERPARLRLTGEVAAGSVFEGEVATGTAVRIMTGAPIPAGADAVLEVERTAIDGGDVLAYREAELGRSLRRAGSDIRTGEMALREGTHIGPAQVALLAALGVARPLCIRRPRVAVIATGDELVDIGTAPGPSQVVDVASPSLRAAVAGIGAEPVVLGRVADDLEAVRRAMALAAEADLIVSVGGVSMGERDLVRPVVEEMGGLDFWQVRMRPGKPLAVGTVRDRPFIGLPGNPVSALVGFEVFVLPTVMAMSGRAGWSRPIWTAILSAPLTAPAGLRTFARARVHAATGTGGEPPAVGDRGRALVADPAPGQGSYQVWSMSTANALLDIPEEVESLAAGDVVNALMVEQPPSPPLSV